MTHLLAENSGEPGTKPAQDDLTRDSLRVLIPTTILLMWLWAETTMAMDQNRIFSALGSSGLAAIGCYVCYRLQSTHVRLAVGVYLGMLAAAVTAGAITQPSPAALYFYVPVVLVAAVLAHPWTTWGTAAICIALVLTIGRSSGLPQLSDSVSPLLLIFLTALAAWLSSRQLSITLDWALHMTEESQKNAQEARARRAEVRSILKSLEEAYVRLERANQALVFAREAAEKAYRFKTEFVANVSHELRTPLNLIVGFSEMMATAPESYAGKRLPSQYRGDVTAIYNSARHLSALIDDVLDLSQMEAGRLALTREEADLGEIMHEATDLIRGLTQAKGLRISIDLPPILPVLRLDSTRIRQVLLNLLSNAGRFTDHGGILVRARIEGEWVRVTVEDSGRGISPERIQQAFQPFSQLDDDRARQGTGLGLAVSRHFVELHGGTMWIESAVGCGTTVGFSLPIAVGHQAAPGLIQTRELSYGREELPLVLVLHDDAHAVTLLRRYVEAFRFLLAETPERAVEIIQQAQPLAVIMESTSAARWAQIVAATGLPDIPPILTCPLPSLRRVGLLLGAADYLAKPLRREDLFGALARLPSPPRTVLIVDDDPGFARLLVRLLKAHDKAIEVLLASGGAEALSVARARTPDLILLDLLMPEVSGYDFLAEMRRDPRLAGLTVIIMSARSFELEAKPLPGPLQLQRNGGLMLTEVVQGIRALLEVVSQPAAVAQASVAELAAGPPA